MLAREAEIKELMYLEALCFVKNGEYKVCVDTALNINIINIKNISNKLWFMHTNRHLLLMLCI